MVDEVDTKIVHALRRDGRMPISDLARAVGVSRATAHERFKRLVTAGTIQPTVRIDPRALGKPLRGFLFVQWLAEERRDQRQVAAAIADLPGIEHVHIITGAHDFLVEVVAADMDEVGRLIIEKMRAIPGVQGTESSIAFWSVPGRRPLD